MFWTTLALAAPSTTPFPTLPAPAGVETGAVCTLELVFADGEQSRVIVPSSCPAPFRAVIRDTFAATPYAPAIVPEHLQLRATFLPGRAEGLVERLEAPPAGLARPRAGDALHLPEGWVRFTRQRSPKTPAGLRQPVICRVELAFDTDGLLTDHTVRGCPPELAVVTRQAVANWRVKPTYLGVEVRIHTVVAITYGPS